MAVAVAVAVAVAMDVNVNVIVNVNVNVIVIVILVECGCYCSSGCSFCCVSVDTLFLSLYFNYFKHTSSFLGCIYLFLLVSF